MIGGVWVAGGFECTLPELDLIGAALGVDVRQFPLEIPPADREGLVPGVRKSLTAKGLVVGQSFAPGLRRALEILAHGRVAVAMLGTSRGRSHRVRAAQDGKVAVVARQRNGVVRFEPVPPEAMVRQVLSGLSPMRPGPGASVTVSAAATAGSYLEPVHPNSNQAAAILGRPRLGSGYVTITTARGEPASVSWVDTDAGRYAAIPDDRDNVTYTPADLRKLEHLVTRLVTKLT